MNYAKPNCIDSRPCFARDDDDRCECLDTVYEKDGECPFCKPEKEVKHLADNRKKIGTEYVEETIQIAEWRYVYR